MKTYDIITLANVTNFRPMEQPTIGFRHDIVILGKTDKTCS